MIESLHNHTSLSDGKMTHKEMFELAKQLDLGVIAFTDHDAVPDENTMEYLEQVRDDDTKWIIGIELTAKSPVTTGEAVGNVHIVGLFVDPRNAKLREHCKKAAIGRKERMTEIVSNLHKLGFVITEEDCLKESKGENISRTHIVSALLKYRMNVELIDRMAEEMRQASLTDAAIASQYQLMIQFSKEKYPYTLFLSPNSFKHAYVESRYLPTLDECVKMIRDAGGVAFFAHYSTDRKKVPMYALKELLQSGRIDGAEIVYGLDVLGTIEEKHYEYDKIVIKNMLKLNNKLAAGGSDAHDGATLLKYASNIDLTKDSIGLAEKIIESNKVDIKNSSLEQVK